MRRFVRSSRVILASWLLAALAALATTAAVFAGGDGPPFPR